MVTHQAKEGHPPEGSMLQTRNLALRLISQNYDQVTTARNGQLPSLGWSPTNPRMVTLHKEVYYRLGIWHLDLPHKTKTRMPTSTQAWSWSPTIRMYTKDMDGHLLSQGWSPTILRMVTHQKKVFFKDGFWHLYLTHKTKNR